MGYRIERIIKQLHNRHYKLTPQRQAIVQVLIENIDDKLSVEEVFIHVKVKASEIGLATIYRTLELLTEINIVRKVNTGDGVFRYQLKKIEKNHSNHHLVCIKCGSVEEIMDDLLIDVEKVIETDWQFKVNNHRLIFHGICKQCQEKN